MKNRSLWYRLSWGGFAVDTIVVTILILFVREWMMCPLCELPFSAFVPFWGVVNGTDPALVTRIMLNSTHLFFLVLYYVAMTLAALRAYQNPGHGKFEQSRLPLLLTANHVFLGACLFATLLPVGDPVSVISH